MSMNMVKGEEMKRRMHETRSKIQPGRSVGERSTTDNRQSIAGTQKNTTDHDYKRENAALN